MLRRLVALALASVAQLTAATAAQADAYRFVSLDFPPLEMADAKGQATGAVVDLVNEVMQRLGHHVKIDVLPWTRSLNLAKEGKADAIFTAYKNSEREAFLDYSREILILQPVSLYVKKGSPLVYGGDFKNLVGHSIGTLSTISYGTAFDQARERLKLKTDRVESLDLSFKKLAAGRVDYVVSNRYSAQIEIERLGMGDAVVELAPPVEVTPSYVAFSKHNKLGKLRDDFDKALHALKQSEKYGEILAKYKVRAPKED